MATKKGAAPADNIDDLIGDDAIATAPKASKAKPKAKADKAPAAKKETKKATTVKKGAATVKKGAGKKTDKGTEAKTSRGNSEVRAALAKLRKRISYADFAEQHGFDIRAVRRTARSMRDDGELSLDKGEGGLAVYMSPAV